MIEELHSRNCLAYIATAALSDGHRHIVLPCEGQVAALFHNIEGAKNGTQCLLRRQGLELKDSAAGQQCVINAEIGIIGGTGDQRDLAIFQKLQQTLLLLFIEILDLIEIEQNAVGRHHGIHIGNDGLHILQGRGGGIEVIEGLIGALGDDVGDGGLSCAGRAVEDKVCLCAVLDQAAQQCALAQKMLLSCHFFKALGTDFVCQRAHRITSKISSAIV